MLEKDLVWEELDLKSLVSSMAPANESGVIIPTKGAGKRTKENPSPVYKKHNKLLSKPSYNVLFNRYDAVPNKPKVVPVSKLAKLADPILGKYGDSSLSKLMKSDEVGDDRASDGAMRSFELLQRSPKRLILSSNNPPSPKNRIKLSGIGGMKMKDNNQSQRHDCDDILHVPAPSPKRCTPKVEGPPSAGFFLTEADTEVTGLSARFLSNDSRDEEYSQLSDELKSLLRVHYPISHGVSHDGRAAAAHSNLRTDQSTGNALEQQSEDYVPEFLKRRLEKAEQLRRLDDPVLASAKPVPYAMNTRPPEGSKQLLQRSLAAAAAAGNAATTAGAGAGRKGSNRVGSNMNVQAGAEGGRRIGRQRLQMPIDRNAAKRKKIASMRTLEHAKPWEDNTSKNYRVGDVAAVITDPYDPVVERVTAAAGVTGSGVGGAGVRGTSKGRRSSAVRRSGIEDRRLAKKEDYKSSGSRNSMLSRPQHQQGDSAVALSNRNISTRNRAGSRTRVPAAVGRMGKGKGRRAAPNASDSESEQEIGMTAQQRRIRLVANSRSRIDGSGSSTAAGSRDKKNIKLAPIVSKRNSTHHQQRGKSRRRGDCMPDTSNSEDEDCDVPVRYAMNGNGSNSSIRLSRSNAGSAGGQGNNLANYKNSHRSDKNSHSSSSSRNISIEGSTRESVSAGASLRLTSSFAAVGSIQLEPIAEAVGGGRRKKALKRSKSEKMRPSDDDAFEAAAVGASAGAGAGVSSNSSRCKGNSSANGEALLDDGVGGNGFSGVSGSNTARRKSGGGGGGSSSAPALLRGLERVKSGHVPFQHHQPQQQQQQLGGENRKGKELSYDEKLLLRREIGGNVSSPSKSNGIPSKQREIMQRIAAAVDQKHYAEEEKEATEKEGAERETKMTGRRSEDLLGDRHDTDFAAIMHQQLLDSPRKSIRLLQPTSDSHPSAVRVRNDRCGSANTATSVTDTYSYHRVQDQSTQLASIGTHFSSSSSPPRISVSVPIPVSMEETMRRLEKYERRNGKSGAAISPAKVTSDGRVAHDVEGHLHAEGLRSTLPSREIGHSAESRVSSEKTTTAASTIAAAGGGGGSGSRSAHRSGTLRSGGGGAGGDTGVLVAGRGGNGVSVNKTYEEMLARQAKRLNSHFTTAEEHSSQYRSIAGGELIR